MPVCKNDNIMFESKQQFRDIFNMLNQDRSNGRFCDIKFISSDEQQFAAHQFLLVAFSANFQYILDQLTAEQLSNGLSVDINSKYLQIVLDYIYTGAITITFSNCSELLKCAQQLQMQRLFRMCCEFIELKVSFDNFGRLSQLVELVDQQNLLLGAFKTFFEFNFNDLISTYRNRWMDVNYVCFEYFVSMKRDRHIDERLVFQLIVDWIRQNAAANCLYLLDLFTYLHFDRLSSTYLQQQKDVVENVAHVVEKVPTAFDTLMGYKNKLDSDDVGNNVIVIIGGSRTNAKQLDNNVFMYNVSANVLQKCASMIQTKQNAATCVLNNQYYVIGGTEYNYCTKHVERFNFVRNEWCELASMTSPRLNATAHAFNNRIYVFGGQFNNERLNLVEMYEPNTNSWSQLPPVPQVCCNCAAVTHNQSILLIDCDTVFQFDTNSNQWSSRQMALSTQIEQPLAALLNDVIYIFDAVNCRLFMYDYGDNSLVQKQGLDAATSRSGASLCVFNDKLYLIGGVNNARGLNCYDAELNQWSEFQFNTAIEFNKNCSGSFTKSN